MKVKDKVIVVTGGGSGIGRATVLHLLDKGAKVAALDINGTTLEETVSLAGDKSSNLSIHTVNITDRAADRNRSPTIDRGDALCETEHCRRYPRISRAGGSCS